MGAPMAARLIGAGHDVAVWNRTPGKTERLVNLGARAAATPADAAAVARSLGLDLDDVLDMLADSPIGVTARSKRSRIESGQYPPNFKLALAVKDMDLVIETAAGRGLDLRVAPAARSWFIESAAE